MVANLQTLASKMLAHQLEYPFNLKFFLAICFILITLSLPHRPVANNPKMFLSLFT